MPRNYAGIAVLVAVVGAGCSVLTDLDGFATPAATDAGPGGGADAKAPVASGDAATSSSSTSSGSTSSSSGGNVDGATPAAAPCDGTHFFCTDFDKRALPQEWEVVTPGDGTITRKEGDALSPPFALEVTHPVGNPGATPVVATTLPAAGIGGLKCSFSYRRDEIDDVGVLVSLIVDFNTTGAEHIFAEIKDGKAEGKLYIAVTAPDATVTDDFPTIPTFSTGPGTWANVEWTLDIRGKKSTLKTNGKQIDQRPFGTFNPASLTTVKLALGLGNFIAPNAPWRVRYDNFVCDALP